MEQIHGSSVKTHTGDSVSILQDVLDRGGEAAVEDGLVGVADAGGAAGLASDVAGGHAAVEEGSRSTQGAVGLVVADSGRRGQGSDVLLARVEHPPRSRLV